MKKGTILFFASVIVFSVSFLLSIHTASASDDLVGYWKFNEGGSGLEVHDSSGTGNNGTIAGPGDITWSSEEVAPISATNPFSLHFDGGGGTGVHVPDSDSLDMTTGITALAWINWDGTGGEDNVVIDKSDHDGGDTPNYRLILKPSGQLALWNGSAAVESAGTVTPNEWTLINFTIDTTSTEFFINGVSAGTGNIGLGAPTNYDLLIGRDAIGRYFHGYIDQVLIYNRILSAEEIGNISNGDTPPGAKSRNTAGGGATGTTVAARYKNLIDQGNVSAAEQLKKDFPTQFVSVNQGTPKCIISTDLKKGDFGEEVKCLQILLGGLEMDGVFGSKTKIAVMLFQQNHPPLDTDGIVGIFTREKLKN